MLFAFLQGVNVPLEVASGILLLGNTALLLRLSFAAGRVVQQVEDHDRRIGTLEKLRRPIDDLEK
jgi:hypothetical protein